MDDRRVVLSLDEGTTGATSVAVGMDGIVRGKGYAEITQHFPQPGWVEHDAEEIWAAVQQSARQALAASGAGPRDVVAIGIANQRETLVVWDRRTLKPLARAIVWQDRRTAADCVRLREAGHEARVREVTGLVIDPYFTATKLAWVISHVPGAKDAAMGTVDSWLVARLSAGRDHVTDASNASRTLLFDIERGAWSEEMADLFGVSLANLAEVRDSSGAISTSDPDAFLGVDAPITGIAGDQQAALFGQACTAVGMAKNTYGTGSFVLVQTGSDRVPSKSGMLTTVAWRRAGRLSYALEGAIFVTGAALQWLRDGLGIIASASEAGPIASSVSDAGGVFMVPAFVGLGAPYWDPFARGTIVGLTRGSGRAQLVRAAVEAMAYQTRDVVEAMQGDTGRPLTELRVDGGASVMDVLCQFQADLLGIPVSRPRQTETTALGAAFLAGLGAGAWTDADLADLWKLDRDFEPAISRDEADALQAQWRRAVERSRAWSPSDNQ
ncbi:MAG TPA: glycerol kinase [Chloroflexi bacterium]|nr:glycerol kinase [Chloroflexota bacterium]HAF18940.1 glycerol kinase [Chloroflexota bacterium]